MSSCELWHPGRVAVLPWSSAGVSRLSPAKVILKALKEPRSEQNRLEPRRDGIFFTDGRDVQVQHPA